MLRQFVQAFSHPMAGILGFSLAFVMAALLAATSIGASRNEAALRARIAQLAAQDARTGALLHAKLVACESAEQAAQNSRGLANASIDVRAERLARREPQGFDVCARMESADRAVLESLR